MIPLKSTLTLSTPIFSNLSFTTSISAIAVFGAVFAAFLAPTRPDDNLKRSVWDGIERVHVMKMLLGRQFICNLGVEGIVGVGTVVEGVLPSIRFKKLVNHLLKKAKTLDKCKKQLMGRKGQTGELTKFIGVVPNENV